MFFSDKKGTAFLIFGSEPCGVEANHKRKMEEMEKKTITVDSFDKWREDNMFSSLKEAAVSDDGVRLVDGNVIDGPRKPENQQNDSVCSTDLSFFAENAFLLLRNAHRIFKDTRMFFTPVPVKCGVLNTNRTPLQNPILGAYLEWCIFGVGGLNVDDEGNRILTYSMSGSLTGSNVCSCVCEDGRILQNIWLYPFLKACKSYASFNKRYADAKSRYESYSFQEMIERLKSMELKKTDKCAYENLLMRGRLFRMDTRMQKFINEKQLFHEVIGVLRQENDQKELQLFLSEYKFEKLSAKVERTELEVKRTTLRQQLKAGDIDNRMYQGEMTAITNRLKELDHHLGDIRTEGINHLLKKTQLSYFGITEALKNNDNGSI